MDKQKKIEGKMILSIIGKEGLLTEQRHLREAQESGHPHFAAFAQEYAQIRQKYIDRARQGLYAGYGITEANIVTE